MLIPARLLSFLFSSSSFLAIQSGDSRLVATHWSFDAGAEEFTRELSKRLPSVAMLSRFSRLLCDANRPIGSETMFRKEAEGKPILLNQNLTDGQFTKGSACAFVAACNLAR
jgi:predicted N-formylglutamate amidohydrolase